MDASTAEAVIPQPGEKPKERDEEFWYEDGNVILVAGNVEFRVFKGILADHSPLFKDMFSLPQPNSAPSEHEPCPVIPLSDCPLDLRRILRILMPKAQPSPFKYNDDEPSFDSISASIRLGHKYQMSALVTHAFDYLTDHFPPQFDDWEKRRTKGPPVFNDARAIAVVNLARAFDRPQLLPSALLACTLLPAHALINGCKREDGSREMLSVDDLARCIHARGALAAASVASAMHIFRPIVDDQCEQRRMDKCLGKIREMLEGLEGVVEHLVGCDLTKSYLMLYLNVKTHVCSACYRMLQARDANERHAVWATLPRLLGVEVEE